ncbi:hypothetical protein U9M48_024524 [Paspalum notatum var. saurae]|uniref:Integrase catalytic domain-containing protein n=1 Tax=Paspalum notatum var. saurae TaxID=547442 RepID=A0AAQ3TLW8_PASNO
MCRVQWKHHTEDEATWEREEELRATYPGPIGRRPAGRPAGPPRAPSSRPGLGPSGRPGAPFHTGQKAGPRPRLPPLSRRRPAPSHPPPRRPHASEPSPTSRRKSRVLSFLRSATPSRIRVPLPSLIAPLFKSRGSRPGSPFSLLPLTAPGPAFKAAERDHRGRAYPLRPRLYKTHPEARLRPLRLSTELLPSRALSSLQSPPEPRLGTVWYKNRICVPDVDSIKKLILSEAHNTAYSIHPGSTKMYHDLKERFWWYVMKRAVAEYVAVCDTCQRVKAEHQRPACLLQPLKIPEWKWEEISMYFIVGLPRTQKGYNSIWVVVDRLTKVAHFIPVITTYSGARLAELYISRIVCLHGVPKRIISDRGSQFTSRFWEQLHDSLDSKLRFGTRYHPRTDGRTERTNRILEDMLRACAIQYGTGWDKSPPYAEFSYNNSYQAI